MTAMLIAIGSAVVATGAAVSAIRDARRSRRHRNQAIGAEWRAAVSLARIHQHNGD